SAAPSRIRSTRFGSRASIPGGNTKTAGFSMASLVLGVVGNAVGGPIGGFIGATIGSMIDNQLFPQKQEGPRLTDLTVQTSTLGNPIPLLFGPENRITGNVIWS